MSELGISKTIITNSPRETMAVAKMIAARLRSGDVVYLYGELGSGKTVFAKGLCRGLGVEEEVTSSSFVIATEYEGVMPVSHIDLYRLQDSEAVALPIDEYILDHGVTIVEWADRIDHLKEGFKIKITIIATNKRKIQIEDFRN